MRIEQLYYLVELSKTRSINRVAEHKFISRQSIGKSIYQLEAEYGVQLLDRSNKGISLTSTGKAFVKAAEEVLEKVENLEKFKCHELKDKDTSLSGSLSISTVSGSILQMLTDVTTHFCKKHPAVKVKIIEQQHSDIILDVENGRSDFGLIFNINNGLGDDEDTIVNANAERSFIFEKIFDDKLVFVAGKTHPLAKKRSISMKQAIKQPLVFHEPADFINKLFYSYGDPKIYHMSNSTEVIKKIISEGLAIGYCMESLLTSSITPIYDKEEFVLIPIREKPKVVTGLLLSKNHPISPVAQEFISMLKSYYK